MINFLLTLCERTFIRTVLRDIRYRDEQDSSRAAAPLRPARDSVTVDTTEIDFAGSEELLCRLIREKLGVEEIG